MKINNRIVNTIARTGDLKKYPKSVLEQINLHKIKRYGSVQSVIIEIMKDLKGYASIEEMILHYYNKTGKELNKNTLSTSLWKMKKDHKIKPSNGNGTKSGVYDLA